LVNPCGILSLYEDSRLSESLTSLGSDPVHLAASGYTKLAEGIIKQVEEDAVDFKGGKRALEEELEAAELGHYLPGRKPWIYLSGQRGSRRGGRGGPRGGQRGGQRGMRIPEALATTGKKLPSKLLTSTVTHNFDMGYQIF
jgi:hypothetical protein